MKLPQGIIAKCLHFVLSLFQRTILKTFKNSNSDDEHSRAGGALGRHVRDLQLRAGIPSLLFQFDVT